ncbi:MAG: vanadium-dependent haloperoxidase [Imperialibacter sp.]|uniref:vanadium-dependent haloperoxidase n=1 Tax=Imperialibacter sp. TaxID=2038411 RepID=UPI0032EE90CE
MERLTNHFFRLCSIVAIVIVCGCSAGKKKIFAPQEVATGWADLSIYITKNTPSNSPTYASRCFGYIGLTMYESVVNGYPSYHSMAGQLNGLEALPIPETGLEYDWLIALNAGQASIIKRIYNQTSDENKSKVDSLEALFFEQISDQVDSEVADRSVMYGKSVADAIFEWSTTDGGHRGYLKNFDKNLKLPTGEGRWEPPLYAQSISHYPLHPHWGDNRTFVAKNSLIPTPELIPHDTTPGSPYYTQFIEVYEKDKALTQEEKEAALWWGDDPADTFTPPGHSYYIATAVIKAKNPELIKCAETYAKMGIAVADAFIECWKWKYEHVSERPSSFLNHHVEPGWVSFWPDPPFPAFPSGHATNAGTAATILIYQFGERFSFTDSSHVGRKRDEVRNVDFKPRRFDSFWEVAEETANSRFYGGIHSHYDNEVGLTEGARIAENVNALIWKNE